MRAWQANYARRLPKARRLLRDALFRHMGKIVVPKGVFSRDSSAASESASVSPAARWDRKNRR
jgi:hypothetical protein